MQPTQAGREPGQVMQMSSSPRRHFTVMGTSPVASRMALQHSATTCGCSIRDAPKQPAPATLSVSVPGRHGGSWAQRGWIAASQLADDGMLLLREPQEPAAEVKARVSEVKARVVWSP